MKLFFASDIHGSSFYCEKMLEAYKREGAEKLILLGDILYHGPRNDLPKEYAPKKVISMLNEIKQEIIAIRGNCDCEVDQMVLEFPVLAEYMLMYIENKMLFIAHGHNFNNEKLPMLKKGDILINGHTHIPMIKDYDSHIYINPGSVSIPKENSPHSYMTLTDGLFEIKELEGGRAYISMQL